MLAAVVAVTVIVCLAIFSLADAPVPVARAVTVLGGAALLVGFLVGPILVGAVDQLDPRRFAVFGVDERQMPWVLTLRPSSVCPAWRCSPSTSASASSRSRRERRGRSPS